MRLRPTAEALAAFVTSSEGLRIGPFHGRAQLQALRFIRRTSNITAFGSKSAAYHPTSTRNHPVCQPETAKPPPTRGVRAMTPTVEVKGLEPSAYGLQSRRSTS